MEQERPEHDRDERVSLAGPNPAEVLKALLKVKPDDDERPQISQAAEDHAYRLTDR